MKVFISWSGDRSKTIGNALKHWLPKVFQGIDVWMSDQNIHAGAMWGSELDAVLKECKFGVICLTPDNLDSHWLTFEAGALSKAIAESRVAPYRFQLDAADIGPPLSNFQGVDASKDGTFRLVWSINDALGKPLASEESAKETFEVWWPSLERQLNEVPRTEHREIRSDRQLLEEILGTVRQAGIQDLNQLLGRLLINKNVRHVELAPKEVAGSVTTQPAFRITVAKKLPLAELAADEVIPSSIFGMPTDVIGAD